MYHRRPGPCGGSRLRLVGVRRPLAPPAKTAAVRPRPSSRRPTTACRRLRRDLPAGDPLESRFQRPQQLMRQLAAHGHRVFYASLGFHDGTEAELSPVRARRVRDDPARHARHERLRPVALGRRRGPHGGGHRPAPSPAPHRLRRGRGATALLDRPGREAPRAVRLADRLRLHGRPLRFLDELAAMLQAEDRTIAAADLVVVTSEVLHEKVKPRAGRTRWSATAATTSISPRSPLALWERGQG